MANQPAHNKPQEKNVSGDWAGEFAGKEGWTFTLHCGNPDPEQTKPVDRSEVALRTVPDRHPEDFRGLHHSEIVDTLGHLDDQEVAGGIVIYSHENGWVRLNGPQLPSGGVIPIEVQESIVSDPDVGLLHSEVGFESPRITKKVHDEYAPLVIAHTIGVIGRPVDRGTDGFDAVVKENGKEVPVTIKTLPPNSPLLQRKNQKKYLHALYNVISPMKSDPDSVALFIPMNTMQSEDLGLVLKDLNRNGIDLERIRILDGTLLASAGLYFNFNRQRGFFTPDGIGYAAVGHFRIAAAFERDEMFDDILLRHREGMLPEAMKGTLDLAKGIRKAKEQAARMKEL